MTVGVFNSGRGRGRWSVGVIRILRILTENKITLSQDDQHKINN